MNFSGEKAETYGKKPLASGHIEGELVYDPWGCVWALSCGQWNLE